MGRFSRKADELLQSSTDTGRAAYAAARNGQSAVGGAYKAQSDADFDAWIEQTQKDYDATKKR